MGSRGAFINVNENDFRFVDGGQVYLSIGYGEKYNIKYLIQKSGSVKVPDYSHTKNRIYAVIQSGDVKSIGIYENHKKIISIDLYHPHTNNDGTTFKEHVHMDLYHQLPARGLTIDEINLVNYIKNEVKKLK